MATETPHESKTKLLNAALHVIHAKGYAATTVDDICHEAGVTKGSFFHHFKSKDDVALSAAAYWGTMTEGFFASAPYHQSQDPLERLLGYVDFRGEILQGELPDYTCLLGTLVQETYATHPDIRAACDEAIDWVKRCPNPQTEPTDIEIRPVFEMDDFAASDPSGEIRKAEKKLGLQ